MHTSARHPDSDGVPQAGALLARLGLGEFVPGRIRALPGRNASWSGPTLSGRHVFVKQLQGPAEDSLQRFRRALAFEETAVQAVQPRLCSPPLLGHCESERLLVHACLDARSGADLLADRAWDASLSQALGRTVAAVHMLPLQPDTAGDAAPPLLPPLHLLDALPEQGYLMASQAELELWGLLQRDTELVESLRRLRESERRAPRRPSHCDLRLDQVLVHEGKPILVDWEEFRCADPARDIGSVVGELLWTAVTRIPAARDDTAAASEIVSGPVSAHDIAAAGAREWQRLRPLATAFWHGYRHTDESRRPEPDEPRKPDEPDPHLAERACGFAGWHLLDRVLAHAGEQARLPATGRAAVGIGRRILTAPHDTIAVLGLTEAS
ncbi:class V lanthionine synthetase subunit LxmK [Streptomyces sp. NPDC001262]|uniref:class V lanthionine synthetase subunit LxmK n=1 Tax=Streptomyces sp. NPDC001262 TaxID=3364552 RepID=UPI0036885588